MKIVIFLLCLHLSFSLWSPIMRKNKFKKNLVQAQKFRTPLYFKQDLDHFNSSDSRTFDQKYLENTDFYNNSHILILYIEGEQALGDYSVDYFFHTTLAREYGAALYALEHRFYGSSVPFDSLETKNLAYLTTEQALADIAKFLDMIISKFLAPRDIRKVLVVGGSYAGVLSSLFRAFYPQYASISLASSAPVLAKADFFEYDMAVADGLGESCANLTSLVSKQVEAAINQYGLNYTQEMFGCSVFTDRIDFLCLIADIPSYLVQYSNSFPPIDNTSLLNYYCSFLSSPDNGETEMDRFINFFINIFLALDQSTCDETAPSREIFTDYNSENWIRVWMYQTCTEYGYFQTAPKNNPVRSKEITMEYYQELCNYAFDNTTHLDTDATNARFGGLNSYATDVMFTNGQKDPWSRLGITNSFFPDDEDKRKDWMVKVILNGSHCDDLGTPSIDDSVSLNETRAALSENIVRLIGSILLHKPTSRNSLNTSFLTSAGGVVALVLYTLSMLLVIVGFSVCCYMRRKLGQIEMYGDYEFGESQPLKEEVGDD